MLDIEIEVRQKCRSQGGFTVNVALAGGVSVSVPDHIGSSFSRAGLLLFLVRQNC